MINPPPSLDSDLLTLVQIRVVQNINAKPDDPPKKRKRGYAFIVYEREKDMKSLFTLLYCTSTS